MVCPHSTLVTDRKQTYFKMNVKNHQVCLAHLLRNAEYLNELDTKQDWSRRFIHLLAHAIDLRRNKTITQRKIKALKTKMKNLLGESLSHLDEEFERFKKGILKVKDYLFTFLSNPLVPYDNNASERGVRKIKVKQKVTGKITTISTSLPSDVNSIYRINNNITTSFSKDLYITDFLNDFKRIMYEQY